MSRSPMVFTIADLHIGNKSIITRNAPFRIFNTIDEHNRAIVENWNSHVLKRDTVWCLGDLLFDPKNFPIIGELKGNKKLILGNHDLYNLALYQEYFTEIASIKEIHGGILTHIPIHPSQFKRYKFNVHGHLHDEVLDDDRYINVCVERIGMKPVSLREIIKN